MTVLGVYLRWLDLLGVPEADRVYRLQIHESADPATHQLWWVDQLGVPAASFHRPTIKRHKPVTVRKNVNEGYHGCLVVRVCRSTALYDAIDGWWQGIVAGISNSRP